MSLRSRHPSTDPHSRDFEEDAAQSAFRTFASTISNQESVARTDVINADIRVYLEGIEVPFTSAVVTEAYQRLPTATINLPPFPGLPEIGKNYFPKVHIFYRDTEYERYLASKGTSYSEADIYRLKFSGVIHRSSYSARKTPGSDTRNISFHCSHKYYPLSEVQIKFGGRAINAMQDVPADSGVVKSTMFGSRQMILTAMQPVKSSTPTGAFSVDDLIRDSSIEQQGVDKIDISILSERLRNLDYRLQGVPGYLVNIWNALKRDSYLFYEYSETMTHLYAPLVDIGLRFFERLSGHPVLEQKLREGLSLSGTEISTQLKEGSAASVDTVVVPPIYQNAVGSATSVEMAIQTMQSFFDYTGEMSSLDQVFNSLLSHMRYDRITLASPVQSSTPGISAVDTLIKPTLPLYYSPTCNVVLPSMYNSIQVQDSYYDVPTRVFTIENNPLVDLGALPKPVYRAPHLYRKAVSDAVARQDGRSGKLGDTLSSHIETFGTHEIGRGIKGKRTSLEGWVQLLNADLRQRDFEGQGTSGVYDEAMRESLAEDWFQRHYPHLATNIQRQTVAMLNPWLSQDINALAPYQRNLMAALDYDQSVSLAEARHGSADGAFNPYIVPGYPCDIISKNFSDPSYHAFVTSVTSQFNASGHMSTSFTFVSAFTYEELESYALPPMQPWLAYQLGMSENPSLIASDRQVTPADTAARDYYMQTLGVGFARPSALYDFTQGKGKVPRLDTQHSSMLQGLSWPTTLTDDLSSSAFETGPLTFEGSMALVRREIETMADIESEDAMYHSQGVVHTGQAPLKFISINRSDAQDISQVAVARAHKVRAFANAREYFLQARQAGKSLFLMYPEDYEDEDMEQGEASPQDFMDRYLAIARAAIQSIGASPQAPILPVNLDDED